MISTLIASMLAMQPLGTSYGNSQDTPQTNKQTYTRKCCNPTDWTLQLRGAAFIPLKHQLRKIYSDGLPTMEIESSYCLAKNIGRRCSQLLLWENVGWTTQSGRSIGFGYHTKLNLVPFSAGLSYQTNFWRYCDFYFGLGPTYSFLRIKNDDGFQTTHFKRDNVGFTTKTGFRFTFCTNFFFDIFADYYYTKFRKMNHDPIQNIDNHFSGFYVGGGFGGKW